MDNKLVSPYANQLQSMPSGAKYSTLGSRNIALIIDHWSYATLTWTWLKHNFLRRHPGVDGRATLDNEDRLFIVRKSRKEEEEGAWKRGGPLIQDFDTAMERYPHVVVQLEGSFKSSLGRFVRNSSIDVVVVCDEFRSRGLLNTWQSVGDFVRQNLSSPFVIIRPEAVRGTAGFRLVQTISKEDRHRDLSPIRPTSSAPTVRKIAIAYPNNFAIGRTLIKAARKLLLQPTDEIYLVHAFRKQGHSVVSQTKKIVRTMTLQKQLEREVTEDNSIEFGAAELEGFPNIHLNVTLRGDPKTALPAFCEQEGIQLLLIGTHTEGLLRKTFSGGSVSGTLIEKAPCVCFSIPYKYMGLTSVDDGMGPGGGGGEMGLSPSSLTSPTLVGGRSGSGALSPGESAAVDVVDAVMSLQRQVEEKDQLIAALQKELERLKMKESI